MWKSRNLHNGDRREEKREETGSSGSSSPLTERKERLVNFDIPFHGVGEYATFKNAYTNTKIASITITNAFCPGITMASARFTFNHKAWLSEFRSPKNFKRLREEIMQQTLEACKNFKYTLENGSEITFADHESVSKDARKTTLHIQELPPRRETRKDEDFETKIVVVNGDCLEEAIRLRNEGFNPAVLNMASSRRPGECHSS